MSPDEKRFVMIRPAKTPRADLIVVEGFFEELRTRRALMRRALGRHADWPDSPPSVTAHESTDVAREDVAGLARRILLQHP